MRRALLYFFGVFLIGCFYFFLSCGERSEAVQSTKTRAFRMGFTPFVHDITAEAQTEMKQFLRQNADLISLHMESVPWAEALDEKPFHENLMNDWRGKKSLKGPAAKIFVEVNPGRGELSDYWGASEHDPMPAAFKGKSFSDPMVKKAYLNYCKRAIEFFQPDYFSLGIEVNELVYNAPAKYPGYVELHQYIYENLKKLHPNLPISASFTLHGLLDARRPETDRARALAATKALMSYSDFVAVSFYPFFGGLTGQVDRALTFLTDNFDSFKRPYAFVETQEAADRITLALDKPWVIEGTPAHQRTYFEKLFMLAEKRRFLFIISFLYRDYDPLWEKIKATSPAFFAAWRDTGLLDERGEKRPLYYLWREWYERPLR